MHQLTKVLFIIIFFITSAALNAQQKPKIPINNLVENVQGFLSVYPQEKVHIHFDKPYYAVGDTLWFKTYLKHNLVEYQPSKIIYVEVLNGRDSLMQTLRVPLQKGVGNGQIVLDPENWSQDNYRFRAYTKWMMNFGPDYFYNKVVSVGDAIKKKLSANISFEPSEKRTKANFQFRDHQGNLLGRRKVTWEATDGWDVFDKGKAETDDMGRLSLDFNAKNKDLMKTGRVKISIDNKDLPLLGDYSLSTAFWDGDVQFFPEGGDLISGLNKKVAFKALNNDGTGARVKGVIKDSQKKEVSKFEDFGMGMGYFSLVPLSGETYSAEVTFGNGVVKSFELPAVVDDAVNLVNVSQDDSTMQLGIVTSEENFNKLQEKSFYILGQIDGTLMYGAQINPKNAAAVVNVPKASVPSGTVQFTLFRTDGTPISERLVFCHAPSISNLNINVKSDKDTYGSKDLAKLSVKLGNNGDTTAGLLSVSVVDETKVPYEDDRELGILSNLLLTSNLKGYVEKPNYYFNTKNENREDALESLLMTQGYTWFDYKELVQKKYPRVEFLPEQGISIEGTLRLNTGRTQGNGGILLSIPSAGLKQDTYTDKDGRFSFDNLVFLDSSKVTVNARGNDNFRNLIITMDQTYFPEIEKVNPFRGDFNLNIDQNLKSYLDNSKNEFRTSNLIDEVVISRSVVTKQTSRDFSALTGLSMPEHRIEADRIKGCNVLTMCLNTLLTGITYDTNTLKYYISRNYNQGSRVPVQFFLNGMPIDEPSLNSIQPAEIEAIEIFLRDDLGTVSRTYQNDGVVSIITRKDPNPKKPKMSLAQIEAMLPKSNVLDLYPMGYVKARKFYSPTYATPESKNVADFRTTIFWKPDIIVKGDEEITLDYYNADSKGPYKVVVEGMNADGKLGRAIYRYNVN